MRTSLHFLATAMAILALFHSCQKKDENSPSIDFILPTENSIYNVYDTVPIQFDVTDETDLVDVSVQLVNAEFIPIGGMVSVNVPSSGFVATTSLVIDDKLLPTADYYVKVTANDGVNEKRAYRRIRIVAVPKLRRGVYCAAPSGQIWKADSLLQTAIPWAQHNGDVGKLVVNSLNDRLTVSGLFATRISNFSIPTRMLEWSDDVFPVAQTVRFNDVHGFTNDVYVALFDRELRRYNLSGALTLNIPTPDHRPELIFVDANYMVVEMEMTGSDDHFLFVYRSSTDVLLRQFDVPMDVVAMCPFDEDELMLFGNENGNAKVILYNMSNNAWWEPRQLPDGAVTAAIKLTGKNYAFTHSNGVYFYTYSPNYLNLIRPGAGFSQLDFDEGSGTLLTVTDNTMEEMTLQGQVVSSLVFPENISSFGIHYTR